MTEKFNSFYTEDKYVDSNPLIPCIEKKIQLELIKLNELAQKFDQSNYQVFQEPFNIDLINQPSSQDYHHNLVDDLNFDDLMDIGKSVIDQSFEFTNQPDINQLQELQPVKDEFFESFDNLFQDVELVGSFFKTDSNSSIRIEKIPSKQDDLPSQELKMSNLKLVGSTNDLSAINSVSQTSSEMVVNKQAQSKPALLPWEMKSKSKLPKTETNQLQKNKKTEQIPRVESKVNANIKQLGSTLKKNILNNASLLSNLKATNTNTGGYKDLVLSVLKKKTPI